MFMCVFMFVQHGWGGIRGLFDLRIFIESDIDECVARLKVRNKVIPGYTPEEIDIRCDAVDRKNAELIVRDAHKADMRVVGKGS